MPAAEADQYLYLLPPVDDGFPPGARATLPRAVAVGVGAVGIGVMGMGVAGLAVVGWRRRRARRARAEIAFAPLPPIPAPPLRSHDAPRPWTRRQHDGVSTAPTAPTSPTRAVRATPAPTITAAREVLAVQCKWTSKSHLGPNVVAQLHDDLQW